MWPTRRIQELVGIEHPIIQAPMARAVSSDMVVAVSEAGGLGSLPCAFLNAEQIRREVAIVRKHTQRPINLNFFCHTPPRVDPDRDQQWKRILEPYFTELGLDPNASTAAVGLPPFDQAMCELVAELKPNVVSFHFGLPDKALLARVKSAGARILSSATTVEEACWLESAGCDAIIAQGLEAGGHRAMFLNADISTQVGTLALIPQVVDAVTVPVIAAGGIADSRGIVAAFALGASAVQIGTAYLFCPEATISLPYRRALASQKDHKTAVTNVFTGRPARAIVTRLARETGPMSMLTPEFPLAANFIAPLRAKSEASGSDDFSAFWSGQAARVGRELPAGELTRRLAEEALAEFDELIRHTS
jgi:nitronate monooxygenase